MLLAGLVFDNRAGWRSHIAEQTQMPFSRFRALRRLERAPMTATCLAEELDVDAAATSVILSDLEGRGLTARRPDPDDGRRKIVSITDAGRALVSEIRATAVPTPALAALTDDERLTLFTLLTKMQEYSV